MNIGAHTNSLFLLRKMIYLHRHIAISEIMDHRQLAVFVSLSEHRHFGRCSEALHMSPSAVTRSLQRLEEALGCELMVRDNRAVRLTAAGRQFLPFAEQTLSEWHRLQRQLSQQAPLLSGELSLYCSVTASFSVLARILESFRQRYPSIDLKVHTGDQADALERVSGGSEDFAIAAHPDHLPSRLKFMSLAQSPLLCIAPAMPCALRQRIGAASQLSAIPDWQQLPFIVSERGVTRQRVDRWFRHHKISPSLYAQVSGHEAIVSMVGLGLGIGVVPELVLNNSAYKERVSVLAMDPPLEPFVIGLLVRHQSLANPLMSAFWDAAASVSALQA